MNISLALQNAGVGVPSYRLVHMSHVLQKLGRYAFGCGETVRPAIIAEEIAEWRLAKPNGLFEYRVEYRAEVTRRGVDDLQHLSDGCLLLQGLARLGNEARVLDRDDRLV